MGVSWSSSFQDLMLVVDAAFMRLVHNVTFPLEDLANFKDMLDRRTDIDLKEALGVGTYKPA